MGDYLEKLAKENRSQFDSEDPSGAVWSAIDKGLERSKRTSRLPKLWKYAAMLLLASTVGLLGERFLSTQQVPVATASDFDQVEQYYVQLIEDRRAQLSGYDYEALEESFRNDLDQLDDLYAELKDQFENDISDPKVRDAMIINLKIRLDILSRQIEILEKLNEQADDHEDADLI